MKKILVIGLSDNIGGIETFFHTYYQKIDKKKYAFDFATVTKTVAFADEYKKNGSKVLPLPSFLKHPFKYTKTLRKIMRENTYDVVHINMLSAANVLPIKAAKKEKISTIIVHSHNSGIPKGLLRKVMDKINRRYIAKGGFIKVACGKMAGEWLFGKKADFRIIPNAIDIEKFRFNRKNRENIRRKFGVADDDILLGNVGRLCEQKNQTFLIEILAHLDAKYKLLIVGSGEKKNEIIDAIANNKLENRVILVENCVEIEKFYSAMDMFAFPSLFEGMPIAPIEAQANGLNCICSKNVTDEVDLGAVKFIKIDIPEWVKAVVLLGNGAQRNKCCSAGEYDIKEQSKNLEYLYGRGALRDYGAKVSIVVAAYNAEKYIGKCLDSIVSQTYDNIEIVVIDDGSTDDTKKIVDQYLRDERVRLIKQKNAGPVVARGHGVRVASGKYCMFVDSDDWIERDAVNKLVMIAEEEKADVVRFGHYIEPGQREYKRYNEVCGKTFTQGVSTIGGLLTNQNFRELAFGFYNTELLKKYGKFDTRLSFGEDYYVNLNVIPNAKKVVFCKHTLYHYVKNNEASITGDKKAETVISNHGDALVLCGHAYGLMNKYNLRKEIRSGAYCNMINILMWSIYGLQAAKIEKEKFIRIISEMFYADFMKDVSLSKKDVRRILKKEPLSYRIFHGGMIKAVIHKDAEKIYLLAKRYNTLKGLK